MRAPQLRVLQPRPKVDAADYLEAPAPGITVENRKGHTGLRVQKRIESSELGPVIPKQATQATQAGR